MLNPKVTKDIKIAIKAERDAQNLYISLSKKSKTRNAKILFESLVVEEEKHEVLLKTYLETGDIEEARKKITVFKTDFNITSKIIDVSYDAMELRSGMITAVKEERKAQKFYMKMWENASKKQNEILLTEVLLKLVSEEKRHESLLIREYTKLFGSWNE